MAMRSTDELLALLERNGAVESNNWAGIYDQRNIPDPDERWLLLTEAACDGNRRMFWAMLHHMNTKASPAGVHGFEDSERRQIPTKKAAQEACDRYASGLKERLRKIAEIAGDES